MKLSMKPDLTGKVAVVTGGAGVLCSEFVRALACCGAKVAILNRTLERAEALAEEVRANGGEAVGVHVDVTDKASVEAAHEAVLKLYGKCDILINGAGGNNGYANTDKEYFDPDDLDADIKTFFDLDNDDLRHVMNLNFIGTVLPSQVFVKDMVGREGCCVVNISSIVAVTPLTKIPSYAGAKAAISNFTQWMAVHFSKAGIRVNAIAPGFFSARQNAKLLWNEDGTPTARTGKILAGTPMGRFGEPTELVGTMLYLVDENSSSFVTGAIIPVDGGFTAYCGV